MANDRVIDALKIRSLFTFDLPFIAQRTKFLAVTIIHYKGLHSLTEEQGVND